MSSSDRTRTVVSATSRGSADAGASPEVLLGRYRVLSRRGTGGFGTVCTCWDTRLQRRVAIKRIPVLAGVDQRGILPSTIDEALAEARTSCLLAHPNIVTVFDFETDGRFAYIVMEYVDGLNLSEMLARVEGGALTEDECAHLVKSLADALSYAHENGVLHLDIKPTNIMIDRQGTVKLADFGMATLASAAGYGGARGGTVGFMPPEQIQGLLVDERADVFSLAVVTWLALTGRNPFAAGTAKGSLDVIARGPKPPLEKLAPELGFEAGAAIEQAILPEASAREASVDDFARRALFDLGDPVEGAASLRGLVDQSQDDDPEEPWDVRHLPLRVRYPWLSSVLERAASSLATLAFVGTALSLCPTFSDPMPLVASVVAAAVCALWPPIGSVLAGLALAISIGTTTATTASFPLALTIGVAFGAWWLAFGRRDPVASAAVLAPSVTMCPAGGVALAGYGMDPLPAAVTGGAGALLGLVFSSAIGNGLSAQAVIYYLPQQLANLGTWVVVLGCAVGAATASGIAMRGSVRSGVVGQVVGTVVTVAALLAASRMENGWVWPLDPVTTCVITLILGVFLCIETVLRGPLDGDQESEDEHELS